SDLHCNLRSFVCRRYRPHIQPRCPQHRTPRISLHRSHAQPCTNICGYQRIHFAIAHDSFGHRLRAINPPHGVNHPPNAPGLFEPQESFALDTDHVLSPPLLPPIPPELKSLPKTGQHGQSISQAIPKPAPTSTRSTNSRPKTSFPPTHRNSISPTPKTRIEEADKTPPLRDSH